MKKVFVSFFCIAFVFGFASSSLATTSTSYQETQIEPIESDQWNPKIDLPNVAWLGWQEDADHEYVAGGGIDSQNKTDVYLKNINEDKTIKLSSANSIAKKVELTAQYVFWLDAGTVEPGLHSYNILTKELNYAVSLPTYSANSDYGGAYLSAWMNRVVYTIPGMQGVYYYDAKTKVNSKISNVFVNGLDFENAVVVFTDTNVSGASVYKYNVDTKQTEILSDESNLAGPFSDNITYANGQVAWLTGNSKPSIYLYNLQSKTGQVVSFDEKYRYNPRIGKNLIVWSESDGNSSYLGIYNYLEQTLNYYVPSKGNVSTPDTEKTSIVFVGSRSSIANVYMLDTEILDLSVPEILPEPEVEQVQAFMPEGLEVGDLFKGSGSAVYYFGADYKRYVFPNSKCYFTWYADFSSVKKISDSDLSEIEIGGNVTYRPGVKMIKAETSNKVYAVDKNGQLRWLSNQEVATNLYGINWNHFVDDVPDAFWVNYTVGADILSSNDFNLELATSLSSNINVDKGL